VTKQIETLHGATIRSARVLTVGPVAADPTIAVRD
jgi:hypothetical protein